MRFFPHSFQKQHKSDSFVRFQDLSWQKYRKDRTLSEFRLHFHISPFTGDDFSGKIQADTYTLLLADLSGTIKSGEDLCLLRFGNTDTCITYIDSNKHFIGFHGKANASMLSVFYGIIEKIPQCFCRPFCIKSSFCLSLL